MINEPLMPDAGAAPRFARLRTRWRHRLDPKSYLGLHLTIGLVAATVSIWLFAALLDGVLDNALLVRWDIAVDAAIHGHMSLMNLRVVDLVTQLGSPAAMVVLGLGGAYGTAYLHGASFSFPSGHAMGSLIGYGMLAYILRYTWSGSRRARLAADGLLALTILAVGLGRVLLGVHYPSDVLGGWAAGGAWMGICVIGVGIAEQRRLDRARTACACCSRCSAACSPRSWWPSPTSRSPRTWKRIGRTG